MDIFNESNIYKRYNNIKPELGNGFVIDSETCIKYTKINSIVDKKDVIQLVLGYNNGLFFH